MQVLPTPIHKVGKQSQRAELKVLVASLGDGANSLRGKEVNVLY